MKNRVLGSSGIEVTPLGYGCMGVSHAYGDALPLDEARAVIRDAYDAGYRFFDTAPAYLGETADGRVSNNEALVGEALGDVKGGVVIATKFGVSINPDRSLDISSRPDEIRASVESSLGYLGVDRIQLLYQHRIDRSTEPEVVAATVSDLMDAGGHAEIEAIIGDVALTIVNWGLAKPLEGSAHDRRSERDGPFTQGILRALGPGRHLRPRGVRGLERTGRHRRCRRCDGRHLSQHCH